MSAAAQPIRSLAIVAAPSRVQSEAMATWLTKEQVLQLTGWTDRWLETQVAMQTIMSRLGAERGRNGRPLREYLAASLPPDARARLTGGQGSLPLLSAAAIASQPRPSSGQLTLSAMNLDEKQQRIALPTAAAQKQAEERLAILQPLIEYDADPARWSSLKLQDGSQVSSRSRLMKYIAETSGNEERTLWRWMKRYQNEGFTGLADKVRKDKNTSRWAAANRELADLAAYVHLEEKRSVRMAFEAVTLRAGEVGTELPSYETIRAFLMNPYEVSPSMKTLALKGRRAYEETFAPYIRRGFVDVAAGELWVSDHMIHDVLVQNDIFDKRDLDHIRLRMTTNLDFRSRYVMGVAWSEEGSSRSITTATRRGLLNFGIPGRFYCDNGKDYRKVAKGAMRHELDAARDRAHELVPELCNMETGIFARLGIAVTYCIPFHPQSKLVERYHKTVHDRFDKHTVAYTGPAPHLRPDAATAELANHKRLLQARKNGSIGTEEIAANSGLPLASEFIQRALAWIDSEYHQLPHNGEGMNGRCPADVFEAERWDGLKAAPNPLELFVALGERAMRKVQECAIEISKRRYVPATNDVQASAIMHESTGSQLTVIYDPCDMDSVIAIDKDGHYLCSLHPETLLRQSDDLETRELISGSMQQRGMLAKATREGQRALRRRVLGSGHISQREKLLQIAQLPASVESVITHRPESLSAAARKEAAPTTTLAPGQASDRLTERLRRTKNDDPR